MSSTKKRRVCRSWTFLTTLLLIGFSPQAFALAPFHAVFFNTENLFDTQIDLSEKDPTFSPLRQKTPERKRLCRRINHPYHRQRCYSLDWSPEIYQQKLKRIAQVLSQQDPKGPDIIGLAEIENQRVLEDLKKSFQRPEDYIESVFIPGHDPRGINLGVLSKWPRAEKPRLHPIPGLPLSRGILEISFKPPNFGKKRVRIFVFHFPSQHGPFHQRQIAFQFLESLLKKAPQSDLTLAMGDSNLTPVEQKQMLSSWGIKGEFSFTSTHPGTHAYQKRWSHFDWIFLRDESKRNLESSFQILNGLAIQKNSRGEPQRFQPAPKSGVSDHFPVQLKYQNLKTKM